MQPDKNNFEAVLRMTDKEYVHFLHQSEIQKTAFDKLMKNTTNNKKEQ